MIHDGGEKIGGNFILKFRFQIYARRNNSFGECKNTSPFSFHTVCRVGQTLGLQYLLFGFVKATVSIVRSQPENGNPGSRASHYYPLKSSVLHWDICQYKYRPQIPTSNPINNLGVGEEG